MAERQNPFAKGFNSNDESDRMEQAFGSSFFAQPKPPRSRNFEDQNPTYSRKVPLRLTDKALSLRGKVNSIVAFDEDGNPRQDRSNADDIARTMFSYALEEIVPNGEMQFSPASSGKLKIDGWENKQRTWSDSPIELKPVPKKSKKARPKQVTLGYRLPQEIIDGIEELAGENRPQRYGADGKAIPDPHRFKVAPGEVMVVLLDLAINAYVRREFRLKSAHRKVEQKVSTWSTN